MSTDTPTVYDQEFFLKLARPRADTDEARAEARERWNAWRRDPANQEVTVTFVRVDFRTARNRGISFEGFEFGNQARFMGATFSDWARFDGAVFGESTRFDYAKFGELTTFNSARFGIRARFVDAVFGELARFDRATFGDGTQFDGATFDGVARFFDSTFGSWSGFVNTKFCFQVSFAGATFGDMVWFEGARFDGTADFSGRMGEKDVAAQLKGCAGFEEAEGARRETEYREWRKVEGIGPSKFSEVGFASARFRGVVSFARRSFERSADFTGVRFDAPPDFDGATNLQRIDFTGARAVFVSADHPCWNPDWTDDSRVAIRLRALRAQIEATRNHDFERDLYIEERKAERGIFWKQYRQAGDWQALTGHALWIGVMGAYWALSDYGRSWLRPTGWLVASVPLYGGLYHALLSDRHDLAVVQARKQVEADWAATAKPGADLVPLIKGIWAAEAQAAHDHDTTVGQLALSNSVPFVGPLTIDGEAKKFLLCGTWAGATKTEVGAACRPIPPFGYQAAMISQNVLSIILVFFIGLALRNYFRLK